MLVQGFEKTDAAYGSVSEDCPGEIGDFTCCVPEAKGGGARPKNEKRSEAIVQEYKETGNENEAVAPNGGDTVLNNANEGSESGNLECGGQLQATVYSDSSNSIMEDGKQEKGDFER